METLFQKRRKALAAGKLKQCLHAYLEGVHFDLLYATPREVAYKAVAVALSDLGSQGGKPQTVVVHASLRQDANEHLLMELEAGVSEAAKSFKVKGDFSVGGLSPNGHLLQVLATGTAPTSKKVPVKAGDLLVVTGPLGAAAGALQCLRQLGRSSLIGQEALAEAYLRPRCRVAEAKLLAAKHISVVDLQDGLAAELNAYLADTGLGALVDEAALPVSPFVQKAASLLGVSTDRWSLYGAEDFELLFATSPKVWSHLQKGLKRLGCLPTVIGLVKPPAHGVKIRTSSGTTTALPARLWHPLVRRRRA